MSPNNAIATLINMLLESNFILISSGRPAGDERPVGWTVVSHRFAEKQTGKLREDGTRKSGQLYNRADAGRVLDRRTGRGHLGSGSHPRGHRAARPTLPRTRLH